MNRPLVAFAGFVAAFSSAAMAARPLTADEHTSLRCAVAFAQVAAGQQRGEAAMKVYPSMAPRGREFFVRLAAQLMDDAGLDEAGIRAAASAESSALARDGGPAGVMPFCLQLLDAQPGLPRG
jgi:hypothetical protein